MGPARKSQGTPLSVSDWLEAGYALIAEEGVRALKIERLCQQVGATRGSFYWHFEDIGSYREALVTSWNSFLEQDRDSLASLDELPPRERLSKMMDQLVSSQHWMLERAMREWARSDPKAAANVRAADRRVLRCGGQGIRGPRVQSERGPLSRRGDVRHRHRLAAPGRLGGANRVDGTTGTVRRSDARRPEVKTSDHRER